MGLKNRSGLKSTSSICLFSSAPDPAKALPLPPKTIIPASSPAPWPCLTLEESPSLFPTTKSYSILSLRVTFNPFEVYGGSSRSGPYILLHAYLCYSASFRTLHTELLWFPRKWGGKAFQVDVHVTCERLEMLKHMQVYRNPPFPGRSRWLSLRRLESWLPRWLHPSLYSPIQVSSSPNLSSWEALFPLFTYNLPNSTVPASSSKFLFCLDRILPGLLASCLPLQFWYCQSFTKNPCGCSGFRIKFISSACSKCSIHCNQPQLRKLLMLHLSVAELRWNPKFLSGPCVADRHTGIPQWATWLVSACDASSHKLGLVLLKTALEP